MKKLILDWLLVGMWIQKILITRKKNLRLIKFLLRFQKKEIKFLEFIGHF